MRSFVALAILACSVESATADDTSSTASGVSATSATSCAAQAVLDDCLSLEQPQLTACPTNDWDCMCNQANNVLTCYNNCPSDANAYSAQQLKVSYCNAASVYGTSASTVPTSTSSPSQSSVASQSVSTQSSDTSGTSSSSIPLESIGSSSSSAATPSSSLAKSEKGVAAGLAVEVGSLLVAMVLGVGAAL